MSNTVHIDEIAIKMRLKYSFLYIIKRKKIDSSNLFCVYI